MDRYTERTFVKLLTYYDFLIPIVFPKFHTSILRNSGYKWPRSTDSYVKDFMIMDSFFTESLERVFWNSFDCVNHSQVESIYFKPVFLIFFLRYAARLERNLQSGCHVIRSYTNWLNSNQIFLFNVVIA